MSLLTDASLIVTPNAYNVGKLYSVIPNTTLGDMDVSRGSSATRVNEQGLIEIARTNQISYSEEFDNASWNGVNRIITANVTTAPDNTMTADKFIPDNTNGAHNIHRTGLASDAYTFSVFAKAGEETTFSMWLRTASFGAVFDLSTGTITSNSASIIPKIEPYPNGWYRCSVYDATPGTTAHIYARSGGGFIGNNVNGFFIWGAQAEAGTTATEYIPTIASIRTKFAGITQDGGVAQNIPRIDYPPLGGCPSILVEPQRTNLILRSEEFNDASWNKTNATISANATISPNGTLTADKLIEGTLNDQHYTNRNITNSNSLFSFSIFAKKSERNFLYISVFATLGNNFDYTPSAYFNLDNGTVGTVSSATATIQDYGNGWYRCTLNCTSIFSQLSAGVGMYIMPATSNGVSGYLGNVTSGIFIWGAQAEAGSTATSYIPTVAGTVTRTADVTYNISATTLIGQTEGTLFVDVIGTKDRVGSAKMILQISGTKSIHIAFYGIYVNIVSGLIDFFPVFTSDVNYKIAVCYSNTGNFRLYINGVKTHEVNTYVGGTFSNLGIGCTSSSTGTNQVNSTIKSAVLWKTALTDDQCILLTGPSFSSYPEMASALIYTLQ